MPRTNKKSLLSFLIIIITYLCNVYPLAAQQTPPENNTKMQQKKDGKSKSADYLSPYKNGDYNEALKILSERLAAVYTSNPGHKLVQNEFFIVKKEPDRKRIDDLFRNRKAESFFIKDDSEMSDLHLYSARCYSKLGNGEAALNHYFESLRYNPLDYQKDDVIFYEISQVYKNMKYNVAYMRSLETAYTLNTTNFEYSLELGKALSKTNFKKKAIFHLERYIESKGDDIPDKALFLTVANLNEDIGRYLETAKYYKKYLSKKNDDGYVYFALGYIAYSRTGDHKLALDCLEKSLKYLSENELFRRAKASEYQGDIYMNDLEYDTAIQFYIETKKYHDKILADIRGNSDKISKLNDDIREAKASMKNKKLYERYDKYQKLNMEKGRLEFANREMSYEFGKINAGKIRWNTALCFERMDKLEDAILYYSEAVSFDYNSNEARDKIEKLKLKIKRGY